MDFVEKLQTILEEHFGEDPGYELQLDVSDTGQVSGLLTLQAFEDAPEYERQNVIWDVLDEALDEDERFRITLIIANAPEETAVLDAEQRAQKRIEQARRQ